MDFKRKLIFEEKLFDVRNETEWTELIDTNHNILCSIKRKLLDAFSNHSSLNKDFNKPVYGDGNTAEKIIQYIKEDFVE